jgi:FkbM family methyltransferase
MSRSSGGCGEHAQASADRDKDATGRFEIRATSMNHLKSRTQELIRDLFRIRTLPRKRLLRKFMGSERLLLADVGATGNPKGVWREAKEFSSFILFDPDPRARLQSPDQRSSVYPVGLWSSRTTKTLSLAVNPEASSVFRFNDECLDDFLNAPLHKVVAQQAVVLDSMENVLGPSGQLPDFIKVDAEGADLEILKGAERYLRQSCLGVFIEVSFAERHKGAPFFSETDIYMRSHNFHIMDLYLERWVRANNVSRLFSRHQLIWGDALYVVSRQEFLHRLRAAEPGMRRGLFAKFLLVLLLYQLHDYADEIIRHSHAEGLITEEETKAAKRISDSAMANGPANLARLAISIILSFVGMILLIPVKHLWQDNLLFLRIQFGELVNTAQKFSAHRYKGCIADPVDPSARL